VVRRLSTHPSAPGIRCSGRWACRSSTQCFKWTANHSMRWTRALGGFYLRYSRNRSDLMQGKRENVGMSLLAMPCSGIRFQMRRAACSTRPHSVPTRCSGAQTRSAFLTALRSPRRAACTNKVMGTGTKRWIREIGSLAATSGATLSCRGHLASRRCTRRLNSCV